MLYRSFTMEIPMWPHPGHAEIEAHFSDLWAGAPVGEWRLHLWNRPDARHTPDEDWLSPFVVKLRREALRADLRTWEVLRAKAGGTGGTEYSRELPSGNMAYINGWNDGLTLASRARWPRAYGINEFTIDATEQSLRFVLDRGPELLRMACEALVDEGALTAAHAAEITGPAG